ncbi:MAG: hypothetical protein HEQ38_13610 [Gemmatimonas sp.]|nr:hypothetical protein [Gemmatimonas sp.]
MTWIPVDLLFALWRLRFGARQVPIPFDLPLVCLSRAARVWAISVGRFLPLAIPHMATAATPGVVGVLGLRAGAE